MRRHADAPPMKIGPGAHQMRQHLSFREHFRRGNPASIRLPRYSRARRARSSPQAITYARGQSASPAQSCASSDSQFVNSSSISGAHRAFDSLIGFEYRICGGYARLLSGTDEYGRKPSGVIITPKGPDLTREPSPTAQSRSYQAITSDH